MADAPRKRRWPWYLAGFALLLLVAALWINHQLEPTRLTATVLGRAGAALGLEITIEGTPDYALRPEPRLVLPKLSVRQPGAPTPLLHAERAEVSLPWSTITGDGSLVITRVELDRPVLDLAALAAWQATRPETPFELPTLTQGLEVVDGTVLGDGWALDMLGLELAELRPGAAASAKVSGQFERQATFVLFEGALALDAAGLDSGFELQLEGRLRDEELDVPVKLSAAGEVDATGEILRLEFSKLALVSASPLPDFDATGTVGLGEPTTLALEGRIAGWPADWPALPAPLSESTSPLDFVLGYDGPGDFGAPLSLQLVRDDTRFDGQLVLAEVLAWIDQPPGSPLPPLTGTLVTPELQVGGVTLEGVRITFEDDEAATDDGDTADTADGTPAERDAVGDGAGKHGAGDSAGDDDD